MKREEPHCKAVRLFPLVEHRGSVWLTCGGGDGSRTNSRRFIVKNYGFSAQKYGVAMA
nr:MAG TPA: hypothetical protein [Caudoviricetes sp.]